MSSNCKHSHTLHAVHSHCGWNNALEPALRVAPGDCIEFEIVDASGGQLTPDSVADDVTKFDFSRLNPVTGPIHIDGAEPGDALAVKLLDFQPSGWGWTAIIPGFGLLADQFTEAQLHHWRYDTSCREPAMFGAGLRVPLKPFTGTIGVAPAEPGLHSVVPPRTVGGNMDIRDVAAGSTLYLPVAVPGALFSVGDTHAAQGDGEVCGTAIESPMKVALQFELVKKAALPSPRLVTPGPVTRHLDTHGYQVTTGIGPDLWRATRDAVRYMIDWLCASPGMRAEDAYMLCSVCGDLRISEIVDQPNWIVSFYFPRVVLEG
ncbi:MAG: acetamidase/formamidase family protein [Thiomonas delicata]|jgi:acetamidase/formamidase